MLLIYFISSIISVHSFSSVFFPYSAISWVTLNTFTHHIEKLQVTYNLVKLKYQLGINEARVYLIIKEVSTLIAYSHSI